jgi:hypothetical protein
MPVVVFLKQYDVVPGGDFVGRRAGGAGCRIGLRTEAGKKMYVTTMDKAITANRGTAAGELENIKIRPGEQAAKHRPTIKF